MPCTASSSESSLCAGEDTRGQTGGQSGGQRRRRRRRLRRRLRRRRWRRWRRRQLTGEWTWRALGESAASTTNKWLIEGSLFAPHSCDPKPTSEPARNAKVFFTPCPSAPVLPSYRNTPSTSRQHTNGGDTGRHHFSRILSTSLTTRDRRGGRRGEGGGECVCSRWGWGYFTRSRT